MQTVIIKQLGITDYQDVFSAMQVFTKERDKETLDELWITQHNPVFTQGQAGKAEHILSATNIPIIQSDRGGQVTYHGLGQIVLYFLIDIRRRKIAVRQMVTLMENIVIDLLSELGIVAFAKADAPGVYITDINNEKKIASLGLRIKNGCCYHGLSLNVDMDLTPFNLINPCGYQGLQMTQLSEILPKSQLNFNDIEKRLINISKSHLL